MPRSPIYYLALVLLCACNGTSNSTTTDTAAKQPEPEPKSPQPPANTFVAPTADALATLETTLSGHLASARQTTDPLARIAALEQAVALDPFDAATLAELAHAYAGAGKIPEAAHSFELALRYSDDVPQRATFLLELGSLAELLGNPSRAAELYNSSVTLHATESAAARLAAVTGGVEVISHSSCMWTQHGPAPQELCPEWVKARDQSPSTCAYEHAPLTIDADTRVELFSQLDPSTAVEVFVVNAILDGIWYSSLLTWVSHPAAEHADENVAALDMRFEEVAPGPPEILFEWKIERRAVDPITKLVETRTTTNLGVLSMASLEPRWWLGLRTASSRSARQLGDDHDGTPTQTSVEVKWEPKLGNFELLRTEHSPSATLGKFPLGSYPLLCPSEIDGS